MADYTGYTDIFKGSLIGSEAEFTNVKLRVDAMLRSFTQGRFEDYSAKDEAAADTAVYILCESYYKALKQSAEETEHVGIASENVDGYSVSYSRSSGSDTTDVNSKSFQQSMYVMARMYLPAYLFYRGV